MESVYINKIIDNCQSFPEKVAVVDNGGTRKTTYGEILSLALKTVAFLSERGVAPHSFVTVKLPSCAEYMAVEIGIWLSRCVAVPMGDKFPQERIDYIIGHCDSALNIDEGILSQIE